MGISQMDFGLLKWIKFVIGSVVSAGLDDTVPPPDVKHVVLTNILALGTIMLLPAFLPILISYYPESKVYLLLTMVCIGLYPLVIILNFFGHRLAAKIYYGILGISTFIAFAILSGRESNMHLYLVLTIVLSFFIFSTSEKIYKFAIVAAAFASFIGLEVWFFDHGALVEVNAEYSKRNHVVLNMGLVLYLMGFSFYTHSIFLKAEKNLDLERMKSDALLHNILPVEIAARLKVSQELIADHFEGVSVLFADIVDFTPMSANMTPTDLVKLLNEVFTRFDSLVEKYDLEKIKTIGDCYMVASGVPRRREDHAPAITRMALDMQKMVETEKFKGRKISFRIGINSGPAVAGVIGNRKFIYDMWGDTVNTASRMESHGGSGIIQITENTYKLIKDSFLCEPKGLIDVKGIGGMNVWHVKGKKS